MTGRVLLVLTSTGVYLLALGSVQPWDAALGLLVATVLVVLLRGRLAAPAEAGAPSPPARVVALPGLVGALLADITRGTWDVAMRVAHLRSFDGPGIVAVPFGDRSPRGVAVTGLLVGLSPGSMLVDVDERRREMLFHVVDATDPDAVRARVERSYQRHQRRVFP